MNNQNQSNKNPTKKPGRKTLIGIVGTIAASILVFTVPQFEGGLNKDGGSTGYRDAVGIPTKCNGDTHNVIVGQKYTSAECRESLQTQLINHAEGVLKCTPILKNQFYQLAAAVSFAYNEGVGAYCNSTIAKRFRAGDNKGACKQFNESDSGKPQWISAKGKVLPGLIIRRAKERQLCETGLYHEDKLQNETSSVVNQNGAFARSARPLKCGHSSRQAHANSAVGLSRVYRLPQRLRLYG